MKFTLSWLKEHLDTTASLDEILDGLDRRWPGSRRSLTTAPRNSLPSRWPMFSKPRSIRMPTS